MAKFVPNKPDIRLTSQTLAKPLVEKVLDETLTLSRRYVPVRKQKPYDRRPTGRLKKSLRKRGPTTLITRITGSVGSGLRYAASVHEGAEPHVIVARNKKALHFYWERRNVEFFGLSVKHPGVPRHSRTQYLYLPLSIVGRRNGFIVTRTVAGRASPLP